MINAITLLGWSSGRNAGDAALLSGIMDSIDEACGRRLLYEIPSFSPDFIRRNYANRVRPIGMRPWNASAGMLGVPTYRSIMRTDLTLVFDAVLFDRSLYNPLFNLLSTLYLLLPHAHRRGKRVGFFNVGLGPVTTPRGRRMLRTLAETADFIAVRDRDELGVLADLGVQNPRVLLGADAALNLTAAGEERASQILRELGLEPGAAFLAVNISGYMDSWVAPRGKTMGREAFLDLFGAALNRVLGELRVPLVLVATQHRDVAITQALQARVAPHHRTALFSNREYSHYEVKAVLGRAALLCSMRLHPSILASSALTPVVGLASMPKVAHYFRTLDLAERCLSFTGLVEESLARHILDGWAHRDAIRDQLRRTIPGLQVKAKAAGAVVAALDRGAPLDEALEVARRDWAAAVPPAATKGREQAVA